MDIEIDFDNHAIRRLIKRADNFGLDYFEAQELAFETAKSRKKALKHHSKKYTTYSRYFNNGLTFYVICIEKTLKNTLSIIVKTVIIERGRE